MSFFLSPSNLETGQQVKLTGFEAQHLLLSRRVAVGEKVKLQGPDGKRFVAEVIIARKNEVTLEVLEKAVVPKEPALKVTLFQAVLPEQPLDFLLQKSTELGAFQIVLFNSKTSAFNLTSDKFENKQKRWEKILWEAAKQSERGTVPVLSFAKDLGQALIEAEKLSQLWLLDAAGGSVEETAASSSLGIFVGPEGGFVPEEKDLIKQKATTTVVALSNFTLRAETAAIAATALALSSFGV